MAVWGVPGTMLAEQGALAGLWGYEVSTGRSLCVEVWLQSREQVCHPPTRGL